MPPSGGRRATIDENASFGGPGSSRKISELLFSKAVPEPTFLTPDYNGLTNRRPSEAAGATKSNRSSRSSSPSSGRFTAKRLSEGVVSLSHVIQRTAARLKTDETKLLNDENSRQESSPDGVSGRFDLIRCISSFCIDVNSLLGAFVN